MLIRKAVLDDIPVIGDLFLQLGYMTDLQMVAKRVEIYLTRSDYALFVVEIERQVIGCAALVMNELLLTDGKFAQLIAFVIDANWRNQKIGERFLKYLESYAGQQGCAKIQLTSAMHRRESGAHRFYIQHGYQTDVTQYFVKNL